MEILYHLHTLPSIPVSLSKADSDIPFFRLLQHK